MSTEMSLLVSKTISFTPLTLFIFTSSENSFTLRPYYLPGIFKPEKILHYVTDIKSCSDPAYKFDLSIASLKLLF